MLTAYGLHSDTRPNVQHKKVVTLRVVQVVCLRLPLAANGTHGDTRHTVVPSKMSFSSSSRAQSIANTAPTDCPTIAAFPILSFAQSCDTREAHARAQITLFAGAAILQSSSRVHSHPPGRKPALREGKWCHTG